ncbi:MAG: DUF1285 domain-containing protein [Venatoribacter sp.]
MSLDSLLKQIGKDKAQNIPPVEKWHPELSGDIDMEIRADGSWWHQGEVFKRQELVNLFASILRHEDNDYFLITPVEKWRLRVEDRPLFISMIEKTEQGISLLSTTADSFVLDEEHPLKVSSLNGVEVAEVKVRHDLWARFTRNAWYDLLELAEEENGHYFVESNGHKFALS